MWDVGCKVDGANMEFQKTPCRGPRSVFVWGTYTPCRTLAKPLPSQNVSAIAIPWFFRGMMCLLGLLFKPFGSTS